jgi:hypothetical protein
MNKIEIIMMLVGYDTLALASMIGAMVYERIYVRD